MSYTCVFCGKVPQHPNDEARKFCRRCNRHAGDATLEDVAVAMAKLKNLDDTYAKAKAAYLNVAAERRLFRDQARQLACEATGQALVKHVAEAAGVDERTMYKWLADYYRRERA